MIWSDILNISASVGLNDAARATYTNTFLLPYLNLALLELEQIFALNDIPATAETSAVIVVPDGTTAIAYGATPPAPALPTDLIEIKRVWQSDTGIGTFIPLGKSTYLPPAITGVTRTSFNEYAWMDQEIRFNPAIVDVDIKIDYIKSLFAVVAIGGISADNPIKNTSLFLAHRIAGLVIELVEEDAIRAAGRNNDADTALQQSLGIGTKPKQSIPVRRRPFRASFKARRGI